MTCWRHCVPWVQKQVKTPAKQIVSGVDHQVKQLTLNVTPNSIRHVRSENFHCQHPPPTLLERIGPKVCMLTANSTRYWTKVLTANSARYQTVSVWKIKTALLYNISHSAFILDLTASVWHNNGYSHFFWFVCLFFSSPTDQIIFITVYFKQRNPWLKNTSIWAHY